MHSNASRALPVMVHAGSALVSLHRTGTPLISMLSFSMMYMSAITGIASLLNTRQTDRQYNLNIENTYAEYTREDLDALGVSFDMVEDVSG
jgi:hypothetical protein